MYNRSTPKKIDKDKTEEFTSLIMKEVGLEVGPGLMIIDQDTGSPIQFKGKDVISIQGSEMGGRDRVVFDPYNSMSVMSNVFSFFSGKYEEDAGDSINLVYNISDLDKLDSSGSIVARLSNGDTIQSGSYVRENLKYADIIMKLNGEENPSKYLKKFDVKPEKGRRR